MISAQIASLYGDLSLRTNKWDQAFNRILRQIRQLNRTPLQITVTVQGLPMLRSLNQQLIQMRRLTNQPFTVNVNTRTTGGARAASPIGGAWNPGRGGATAGSPTGFMGGSPAGMVGTGAANVLMGGAFALNPYMAVGALGTRAGLYGIRQAISTESATASLGGLAGISPGRSASMVNQLGATATETPGLRRSDSFGLADVLARAGVGAGDIPGTVRSVGRLTALTPDADPKKLAEDVTRTMNAYGLAMDRVEGFTQALAALDAAAVATAPEILDITRRMAGSGRAAGLDLNQIMALGAEMRSVGLRPESGSTAMARIFGKLANDEDRAQLEAGLGIAGGTLGRQFQADPMAALSTVFGSINRATNQPGSNALDFIQNTLGFENQRDIMAAGQLSGRMGNVASMTALANRETQSGSIMADRFERELGTTAAALEQFQDSVADVSSVISGFATGPLKLGLDAMSGYFQWVSDFWKSVGSLAGNQPMQAGRPGRMPAPPRQLGGRGGADLMGPFGGFTNRAAQLAFQNPRRAGDLMQGNGPSPLVMRPTQFGDPGFVGPPEPRTPVDFMAAFNPENVQDFASRLVGGARNLSIGLEAGIGRFTGAARADIAAREGARRQFMPSITDPMSAMQQQQVDILSPDLQQQSVNLLGEINEAMQEIRQRGSGLAAAVPAALGGGVL